jgi:integral membrane sensor domain MASE1
MMFPKVPASMAEKAASNVAPGWPRARDVLLFAAALFLADRLGLLFAPAPAHVSAVWPSAGVTLAAALYLGRGAGAVIWVVAFLVGGVFSLAAQGDWRAAVGIEAVTVTGSALRAVLGAALLRRF